MFLLIVKFFDALLSNWKGKLIGISSDGASNMTGAFPGVVTRLQQLALPGLYRIWCCAHQMDLVVQKAIAVLCNKNFVSSVMGITGYLRRQVNLISEMQSKCPRFVNTRWLSMEKFLSWLILNRPCLTCHFDEKRPSCSPTKSFWIMAYVLKGFVQTVNLTLVAIQGLSTLLNEQGKCLELLVNTLKEDCNVKGPDQFTEVPQHVLCGSYQVSYEDAETLIKDQDLFILGLLEDILTTEVPEYTKVIHSTALLYAYSVDGFTRIVASQNAQNGPTNNLPSVMPQELIQMRPFEFSQIVLLHKQCLEVSMSEYDIVKITDEFKQL